MPWHNVFQYSYRRMKATWCHHIKKVSSWKVPLVPMNQQYISNDIIFRDRIIIPICEHLGNLKKTHLNMLYWPIGLLAYWLPIGNQTSVLGAIAPLWCLNADVQTSAHKNILPMFEHADDWTWSNLIDELVRLYAPYYLLPASTLQKMQVTVSSCIVQMTFEQSNFQKNKI